MRMLFGVTVNALAGVLIIVIFVAMGFSGVGVPALLLAICFCCLVGFALSYVFSLGRPGHIWVYSLAYVVFPLLFVYSSGFGANTGETRLKLTAVLAVIYGVSLVGGVLGSRMKLAVSMA